MGSGMFSSTLPCPPLPSPGALETITALALQPVWLISGACKEAGSPPPASVAGFVFPKSQGDDGWAAKGALGGAGDLFKLR